MKINTIIKLICYFGILFPAIVCCDPKSGSDTTPPADNTKPVISLISPANYLVYKLGNSIALEVDFSDNQELKSYKVEIRKSLKVIETSDWVYSNSWSIPAGKTSFKAKHSEIIIPTTVTGKQTTTGNYNIVLTCYDSSGNESNTTATITINM